MHLSATTVVSASHGGYQADHKFVIHLRGTSVGALELCKGMIYMVVPPTVGMGSHMWGIRE